MKKQMHKQQRLTKLQVVSNVKPRLIERDAMNKKVTTPVQVPPYHTGKVKIGAYYQPPKQRQSDEDLMLQSVLLGDKHSYFPQFQFDLKYIFYVLFGVLVYIGAIALTK